jgi:nucleotide-binding universal stress UspA family protein
MKKVLLAIDGMTPDQKALQYTVQLCRRIKAELNVLQVISPKGFDKAVSGVRQMAKPAKRYLEGAFAAAAFAEAGEHETAEALMTEAKAQLKALMAESETHGIRFELTVKAGHLKREIIRYLNEHRDVVLAIYDAQHRKAAESGFAKRFGAVTQEMQKALPIPLVVIQDP